MRLITSFMTCSVAVSLCSAETINISGIVKDSIGNRPLSGAIVQLAVRGLADTTDSSGLFSLVSGATYVPGNNSRVLTALSADPVLVAGVGIRLSLAWPGRVVISGCRADGRQTLRYDRVLPAGTHLIGCGVAMRGVVVYRVLAAGGHWTLRQMHAGPADAALGLAGPCADPVSSLARAGAGFADTLVVIWAGHSKRVAISNAISPDMVIELVPATPKAGMRKIAGGSFQMGCTEGRCDEQPVHAVTVSTFWMDTTEVTQRDYQSLMGVNPTVFTNDANLPVERSSWFDAVLYCNKRSTRDGKDTVYAYTGISGTAGNGCTGLAGLSIDMSKNGYRLPTEAEWEYACRAGTTTAFYWGNDMDSAAGSANAWYNGNSGSSTHPVAQKARNAFGLYDMNGNVWEWCNDWYGSYGAAPEIDPTGPSSGSYRVLRGGAWLTGYSCMRSAGRNYNCSYDWCSNFFGFRCVCR